MNLLTMAIENGFSFQREYKAPHAYRETPPKHNGPRLLNRFKFMPQSNRNSGVKIKHQLHTTKGWRKAK